MCKLRKESPPVNLAAVTCDSWSGMNGKLVPWSIIVFSMGSSTARGVKITGVCRSPPLPDGVGRRRLVALSGLPDSAARRQHFFWLVLYQLETGRGSQWIQTVTLQTHVPCVLMETYTYGLSLLLFVKTWHYNKVVVFRYPIGINKNVICIQIIDWLRLIRICWVRLRYVI